HQHERQHRFGDRRGAYTHARIVAARCFNNGRRTALVDGTARQPDAGSRFDGDVDHHILTRGNAAEYAAGVVGQESLRRHFIAVLGALLLHRRETSTDLDTLHRVYSHHGIGDVGVELVI